ncbi:MAG: hypothetical protein ICV68_02490 [Pyrinomonadaceae bacterium]|nr:hypothetical protein [Pyrinomonadaceae bacterium]
MMVRALFCFCLLALFSSPASAQRSPIAGADRSSSGSESSITIGSPMEEMIARRDIKVAEKERRENLERAREAAQLGNEIHNAFTKNQTLGRTELKKLERLEKLTRRIREEAGGSSGDVTIENPPQEMKAALGKLAELSEEMRKGVEKTPRQVVSAFVIERTNEVLEIIRYVRSFLR